MRSRLNSMPLFWRVFGTNAAVLVLAFLGLVFAPVTVSVPPAAIELAVLMVGLLCLLALNLVLLRPAFRPLDHLVETMRRHDPLTPGNAFRSTAVRPSPRSRMHSTTCSTVSSPSGARAGVERCLSKSTSVGGSPASCTTRSVRP